MSYYAGFGQAPVPAEPSSLFSGTDLTQSGVTGLAVKALMTDPNAPPLSAFSSINLSYLQTTFGSVLEAPLENVANMAIAAMPDAVMAMISDVVSAVADVVDIVPIVGQVFSFVAGIVKMATSLAPNQQELEARATADCQTFMRAFEASPSGGALDPCQMCPADIFYPSISFTGSGSFALESLVSRAYRHLGYGLSYDAIALTGPNGELPYMYRPALGMALMRITEGAIFDPLEVAATNRADFERWNGTDLDRLHQAFGGALATSALKGGSLASGHKPTIDDAMWWGQYGGIPADRRALFRAVRRGIQSASKYYGNPTDAGLSLWPIYMDLLINAYDTGMINDDWVAFVLGNMALDASDGGDHSAAKFCDGKSTGASFWLPTAEVCKLAMTAAQNPCGVALAKTIRKMVESWRSTTLFPATAHGRDQLAKYRAVALAKADQIAGKAPRFKYMHLDPKHRFRNIAPVPVKKAQPVSALWGAGAAAAAIYFLL